MTFNKIYSNRLVLLIAVLFCLFLFNSVSAAPTSTTLSASPSTSVNASDSNERPLTGPVPTQGYVLYWDEIVLGLVFMAIGVIECLWGYRLIRLSMFVVGFLVFSSLTLIIILFAAGGSLTTSFSGIWPIILVWLLAGIIGSIICFIFWHFGLALVALYGGFQLGLGISGFASIQSYGGRVVLIIVLMLIAVILTRLFERHVIIITTSLGGAFTFVWGIDEFAHQGFREMLALVGPNTAFHPSVGCWIELVLVVLVFAAGTGYEYWAHEKPDPSNLFGDGTRRAHEEIHKIEGEIESYWDRIIGKLIKKKNNSNPAQPGTPTEKSPTVWSCFGTRKNKAPSLPASTGPTPTTPATPATPAPVPTPKPAPTRSLSSWFNFGHNNGSSLPTANGPSTPTIPLFNRIRSLWPIKNEKKNTTETMGTNQRTTQ